MSSAVTVSLAQEQRGKPMGALLAEVKAWRESRRAETLDEPPPKVQEFTPEQRAAAEAYERVFARTRHWVDPAVRGQALANLERLRARLLPQERAVVELVACRGRGFREVAEQTGRKVEELKALYRRGLDKLVPHFERRAV